MSNPNGHTDLLTAFQQGARVKKDPKSKQPDETYKAWAERITQP